MPAIRKSIKKIKAVVEKTDTGWAAFAAEYAIYTTGKSIAELQDKMIEELNICFQHERGRVDEKRIIMEIDLKQFFQHYKVLNAKFLAERIGMNPTLLSHYVQGRKKPSPQQAEKIMKGIKEIARELSGLRFAK